MPMTITIVHRKINRYFCCHHHHHVDIRKKVFGVMIHIIRHPREWDADCDDGDDDGNNE